MSLPLVINGFTYSYPEEGDQSWGQNATLWAQAVTNGMLQKAGGSFPLTANVDFGASYGLVSSHFTARTSNSASAGALRLAKTDVINWRDNTNTSDLSLGINVSDELTFNNIVILTAGTPNNGPSTEGVIEYNNTGSYGVMNSCTGGDPGLGNTTNSGGGGGGGAGGFGGFSNIPILPSETYAASGNGATGGTGGDGGDPAGTNGSNGANGQDGLAGWGGGGGAGGAGGSGQIVVMWVE